MIDITLLDVTVWLIESSMPIEHKQCTAYQKGSFYCVYQVEDNIVFKYPIDHIWRLSESYPKGLRK